MEPLFMALLQWNCNGLKTNFNDLKIVLNELHPFCVALKETHLQPYNNIVIKNYNIYRKDNLEPNHSHYGVSCSQLVYS